jgi:hypothetical protein
MTLVLTSTNFVIFRTPGTVVRHKNSAERICMFVKITLHDPDSETTLQRTERPSPLIG